MRFESSPILALLAPLLLVLGAGPAEAGGRLPSLRYRGGAQGHVIFDHQMHASKGFHCNDCHTDFARTGKLLFSTRKDGLIAFADHRTAAKCFACHDGKGATEAAKNSPFYDGQGAFDDCERCHYKDVGAAAPSRRSATANEPRPERAAAGK